MGGLVISLAASWALSGLLPFMGQWEGSATYVSETTGETYPMSCEIRPGLFRVVVSLRPPNLGKATEFYGSYSKGRLTFGPSNTSHTMVVLVPDSLAGEVRREAGAVLAKLSLHRGGGR